MRPPGSPHRIETRLIHAGEPSPRIQGAVVLPIFQSSTYVSAGEQSYHDIRYVRLSNTPNHVALGEKLAAIEGGEAAVVTGSGMAAISTTLLTLLAAGDHLLVQRGVYGGTHDLITKDLPRLGIEHTFVDGTDPASWKAALRRRTRLLYVETLSNPLLAVADVEAASSFARAHGLVSVVDNTFASPVNFRPIEHGFDIVLHSATKYLNGHSDIGAGAVIGRREMIESIKHKLDHLGGVLDPHACFLLHRGLKTLSLRVRHQNAAAMAIARWLEGQPGVGRVFYPMLPSHPGHARARGLLEGGGGVLSFELEGGVVAAERLIGRLRLAAHAPSLGGTETLITRPAESSHAGLSPEERRAAGISDGLVRLSLGLEATEDLVDDLAQALRLAG
jgi:cystathionine beta-lyase/cystathionine gamma-synthase